MSDAQSEDRVVHLADIRRDPELQSRVSMSDSAVTDFAEAMADGWPEDMPRVVLYEDPVSGILWLVEGHHRHDAAQKAQLTEVPATVHIGDRSAALLASFAANKNQRALRRTNADKIKAVQGAILHPTSKSWAASKIAEFVGVHPETVRRQRKALGIVPESIERTDGRVQAAPRATASTGLPLFDAPPHGADSAGQRAPVAPAPRDAATTPPTEASGAHAPACAVCGAEPCACSRVATPEGEPDPDVPPEIENDAPPWEGGAADTEVPISTSVDPDVPAALTDETQRRAWATLTREVGPLLDAVDEHKRGFRALIERPLGSARDAILPDTAVADLAAARRVFAGIETDARGAIDSLTKLRNTVAHLVPHEVCRECNGARCGHCRRRGFIFAAEASQRGNGR